MKPEMLSRLWGDRFPIWRFPFTPKGGNPKAALPEAQRSQQGLDRLRGSLALLGSLCRAGAGLDQPPGSFPAQEIQEAGRELLVPHPAQGEMKELSLLGNTWEG